MGSYIHDDEPPGVLEEVGELVALVMAHRGIEVLGQTFFLVVLLGAVVEVRASQEQVWDMSASSIESTPLLWM